MTLLTEYLAQPVQYFQTADATIAYRVFGDRGPGLLLTHGFPVDGSTYRAIIPDLSQSFRCVVPDLPGWGASQWDERTEFSIAAQAARLRSLMEDLKIERYGALGFDSGGAIVRHVAADNPAVERVVLLNTEIPGYEWKWLRLYRQFVKLPRASTLTRLLLRVGPYRRSPMAFGDLYYDKRLLRGEFEAHVLEPILDSDERLHGAIATLTAISARDAFDSLPVVHRKIRAKTLLIWGADDGVFPAEHVHRLANDLEHCEGVHLVQNAKLLVHEEHPAEVLKYALPFFAEMNAQ